MDNAVKSGGKRFLHSAVFLTVSFCSFREIKQADGVGEPAYVPISIPLRCAGQNQIVYDRKTVLASLEKSGRISDFYSLKETQFFTVGMMDGPPAILQAYRRVFHDPKAREAFSLLFDEARFPEGKLYALGGLFYKDYCSFVRNARELQKSPELFHWWGGDTGDMYSVSAVLNNPRANVHITEADTDYCRFLLKLVCSRASDIIDDFAGGGIPLSLAYTRRCNLGEPSHKGCLSLFLAPYRECSSLHGTSDN